MVIRNAGELCRASVLAINPVTAEASIRFERVEELEAAMPPVDLERLPLPFEAPP